MATAILLPSAMVYETGIDNFGCLTHEGLITNFSCWCSHNTKAMRNTNNGVKKKFIEIFIFEKTFCMATALKFMIDENGEKTSVLVPLKTWEKINQDYSKLQNKLKVLTGIKEGLAEVRDARKAGKKLQTLKDFLREKNS